MSDTDEKAESSKSHGRDWWLEKESFSAPPEDTPPPREDTPAPRPAQTQTKSGLSSLAKNLKCCYCQRLNRSDEWPLFGDRVPFYFQRAPGNYYVAIHCPFCNRDWYVVWDTGPGPMLRV